MTGSKATAAGHGGKTDSELDDDDEWRKMSLSSKAVHAARNVTVEPLLGLFQLSMVLSNLTTQNLNLQKACRVNLQLDEAACTALETTGKNGTSYRAEEVAVQQLVAGMMVWQNVVQNTLPCALAMFIGSWSDRHRRRKPFMLMPIFGELVRNAGLIACVYYFYELPMEVAGFVESVPSSLTGSIPVLFLAVFAYVGDISTVKNRTLRVGLVSLCSSVSVPIGAALSGVLFRDYGFYGVYAISTALYVFSFVYGATFIADAKHPATAADGRDGRRPKTVAESNAKSSLRAVVNFFDLRHVRESFRVTFRRGADDRRRDIALLIVIVVIILGPLSGEQSLTYFLTRVQFNWNEVDYSIFSTYYFICNLVGIGFTLCVLVKRFELDDRLIGAIGCLSKGLAAFVYAFAPTEFVFYLGPIVDIFHGTAFVAMRSLLSKLVPANELGQVLAVFSLVETVVPAVFKPLYSAIYQRTLHRLPGAFYIFGGTINLPGVLIFLWMYSVHRKKHKNERPERESPKWMYRQQKRIKKYEFSEEKQALSAEHPDHHHHGQQQQQHNNKICRNY